VSEPQRHEGAKAVSTFTPEEEAAWVRLASAGDLFEPRKSTRNSISRVPALTDAVKAVLEQRYPDRQMPFGTATLLAHEFGLSRERIRQIAVAVGMVRGPRPAAVEPPPRPCRLCERPARRGASYCLDCGFPVLQCIECGAVYRRRRAEIERWRSREGGYAGRFNFCSRACLTKRQGRSGLAKGVPKRPGRWTR
jgi:hypothetical protein